jgi:hypothetical protein
MAEENVSVALVAAGTSLNVVPPSVLTCHCTVGNGLPVAADVKATTVLAAALTGDGCSVTVGALFTARMAAVDVAAGDVPLVHTARYWCPWSDACAVKTYAPAFAPAMSLQLVPPSVLTCHWTLGTGNPLAAELNFASLPAHTIVSFG